MDLQYFNPRILRSNILCCMTRSCWSSTIKRPRTQVLGATRRVNQLRRRLLLLGRCQSLNTASHVSSGRRAAQKVCYSYVSFFMLLSGEVRRLPNSLEIGALGLGVGGFNIFTDYYCYRLTKTAHSRQNPIQAESLLVLRSLQRLSASPSRFHSRPWDPLKTSIL